MHSGDENFDGGEGGHTAKKRKTLILYFVFLVLLSAGGLTFLAIINRHNAVERQNILKQTSIAKSKQIALENEARKNAKAQEEQQKEASAQTEKQKKVADIQKLQESIQRNKAQLAKLSAEHSEKKSELEKKIAKDESRKADSLKKLVLFEKSSSENLRLFENANSLAIKSLNFNKHNEDNNLKALLALWAYKLNSTNRNDSLNPDIMLALYEANKAFESADKYVFKGHNDVVKGLAVSPNSRYLASAGADGKVILWDLAGSKPSSKVLITAGEFSAVAFSPDNKWLAACSGLNIYKWNLENPGQKPEVLSGHTAKITSLIFTNTQIVSGGLDKMLLIYDMSGNVARKDSFDSRISSLAFSGAQNLIGVGFDDGTIYLIRQNDKKQEPEVLKKPLKQMGQVSGLSFNDKGNVVAAAYANGSFNVYYTGLVANKQKSSLAKALPRHIPAYSAVVFGKSNLLASAGLDGKVKLWQWARDIPPVVFGKQGKRLESIAISPDGKRIFSGGKDKNIYVYDIDQQDIVNRLKKKITRNLTPYEWNYFMGNVPYQKLIDNLQ